MFYHPSPPPHPLSPKWIKAIFVREESVTSKNSKWEMILPVPAEHSFRTLIYLSFFKRSIISSLLNGHEILAWGNYAPTLKRIPWKSKENFMKKSQSTLLLRKGRENQGQATIGKYWRDHLRMLLSWWSTVHCILLELHWLLKKEIPVKTQL